jgi:ABC-2 type transport system permease protein
MGAIFKRELRSYFTSPSGYIFVGLFLLISGIYFSFGVILSRSSDFASFLDSVRFIFLVIVPILTMRLMSEETRQKTDQLLYTSPVSISDIVLGKFLAAFVLFLAAFAVILCYSIVIIVFGDFKVWESIGASLGFILIGGCFIAVGVFISTMTESQTVSAVATFAVLLLFWILEPLKSGLPQDQTSGIVFACILAALAVYALYTTTKSRLVAGISGAVLLVAIALTAIFAPTGYTGFIAGVIGWFSLLKRQQSFTLGLLKLDDTVYYVSFIFVFLFLSVRFIEKRRWM